MKPVDPSNRQESKHSKRRSIAPRRRKAMSNELLPFTPLETVPGYRVELISNAPPMLFDVSVKGINVFRDFFAKLRDFFGGETHSHVKVIQQTVEELMAEMSSKARAYGADAIIKFQVSVMPSPAKNMSLVVVTVMGAPVRLVPERSIKGDGAYAAYEATAHSARR
ncbi:MAG: hypothetical protein D6690_05170 [Nitrospirae bacterium]|nr:MAG: hypothetical protein D6690_05170 [Nitrospirota bacterium]